jgi:nitric oxide reductase subunit C
VTIAEMNEQAVSGKELFQKYNCGACHQIYGLGGYLGPELTDVVSKPGKTAAYLKAMMNSGIPPMPVYNLKDEETDQLLAYLIYINQTVPDYKK